MIRPFVASLALVALLAGFTSVQWFGTEIRAEDKPAAPQFKPLKFTLTENLQYGEAGGKKLELDLAKPDGEGPFPGLVFIHGGGWRGGNRQSYRPAIQQAAALGYVAVTVSYRLTNPDKQGKAESEFPAQIHDVKQAIRWFRAHAAEHKLDPTRVGVVGASAGGHLSLLAGLTDKSSGLEGPDAPANSDTRVQAVVNYFGPTDFPNYEDIPAVKQMFRELLGGTLEQKGEAYKLVSPITHATADDPPVLTLHGDKDLLVPLSQAELLDKKMKEVGAKHELVVMTGQGHGFPGEHAIRALRLQYEFFDKHLKSAPAQPAEANNK